MGDTLIIGGRTFNNVAGFKATDNASVIQMYTKGGGFEYEEGTWTPAADIDRPTITFQNQHNSAPIMYAIGDFGEAAGLTVDSNTFCSYICSREIFGAGIPWNTGGTNFRYAHGSYIFTTSNGSSYSAYNCGLYGDRDDGSTSNMPSYWATSTAIRPNSTSTTRYWRAGRTYKWIAVWAPTT